ncbi:MAG: FmdB family transcriptional regulator [Planctomyces sp.]|nr:FmdB family transcriptional regulator [Planctomyces sp.]
MPVYVYEVVLPDGSGGDRFELVQRMADDALTQHPETGEPVRRVIQAVNIGGSWSEGSMHRKMQDDKRLGELGFTKYVKSGDGTYEKTTGKGPKVIKRGKKTTGSDFSHLD